MERDKIIEQLKKNSRVIVFGGLILLIAVGGYFYMQMTKPPTLQLYEKKPEKKLKDIEKNRATTDVLKQGCGKDELSTIGQSLAAIIDKQNQISAKIYELPITSQGLSRGNRS